MNSTITSMSNNNVYNNNTSTMSNHDVTRNVVSSVTSNRENSIYTAASDNNNNTTITTSNDNSTTPARTRHGGDQDRPFKSKSGIQNSGLANAMKQIEDIDKKFSFKLGNNTMSTSDLQEQASMNTTLTDDLSTDVSISDLGFAIGDLPPLPPSPSSSFKSFPKKLFLTFTASSFARRNLQIHACTTPTMYMELIEHSAFFKGYYKNIEN